MQKVCLKLRTLVIIGSYTGSFGVQHGNGLFDEIEIMEYAGLPSIAVVNSATGISSQCLKFKEKFG